MPDQQRKDDDRLGKLAEEQKKQREKREREEQEKRGEQNIPAVRDTVKPPVKPPGGR